MKWNWIRAEIGFTGVSDNKLNLTRLSWPCCWYQSWQIWWQSTVQSSVTRCNTHVYAELSPQFWQGVCGILLLCVKVTLYLGCACLTQHCFMVMVTVGMWVTEGYLTLWLTSSSRQTMQISSILFLNQNCFPGEEPWKSWQGSIVPPSMKISH